MRSRDLEILLSAKSDLGNPEAKAALVRLSREVSRRLERGSSSSSDFIGAVLKGLLSLRGSAHADIRIACLYDCGVFFYVNGSADHALSAARSLEEIVTTNHATSWFRKTWNLCGMVSAEAGNLADAVIHYARALEQSRATLDKPGELAVLINLGIALNYGSLYRDAIPCFQRAISIARHDPEVHHHFSCALGNLAQSYRYLGEYENGYRVVKECLSLSFETPDAFRATGRAIREFTALQLALALSRFDDARTHLSQCQLYSRLSGTVRSEFVAKLAAGLFEIHCGDVSRGLASLEKVLQESDNVGAYYAAALTALVEGYEEAKQPEKAQHHMNALLEYLKGIRESGLRSLPSIQGETGRDCSDPSDLHALRMQESRIRSAVAEKALLSSQIEMLERLAVTADIKEDESGEHGYRVGRLCAIMAGQLGWTKEACEAIDLAARLHDIGKIAMPDRILLTSEQLKEAERNLMSTHTSIGAELLAKSNIPQLQMAEEIARFHHEWWDGTGYPAKRSGKRIPIHARMVALADVFDALTHGRPFSEPWPMDRALDEIRARQGSQFDPELTDLFLAVVERLRREHTDLDAYLGEAGRSSPFLQARHKIRLLLADTQPAESPARERETVH